MWRLISLLAENDFGTSDITGNTELKTAMDKIADLVTSTIMPIIYVVLAIFLVVKGALLGVQIVKAADEPQVRQEKINSLKWLIIGVAIAYGVAAAAHIVTGSLKGISLS